MDQRELAVITRLLGSDIKKPTALVHFQRQMSQVAQRIMTLLIFNAQETEPDTKGLRYLGGVTDTPAGNALPNAGGGGYTVNQNIDTGLVN
jgi:hypothetical protein